jgi:hypothetical protein
MKRMLFALTLIALGWFIRPLTEPVTTACMTGDGSFASAFQAATSKSDLINLFRQDATSLLSVRAKIRAHKASYDALAFTWADGDFTGTNAGITAVQFTSAVANLTDVCDKFDLGGSLPVGLPTGVNRIASMNLSSNGAGASGVSSQIASQPLQATESVTRSGN